MSPFNAFKSALATITVSAITAIPFIAGTAFAPNQAHATTSVALTCTDIGSGFSLSLNEFGTFNLAEGDTLSVRVERLDTSNKETNTSSMIDIPSVVVPVVRLEMERPFTIRGPLGVVTSIVGSGMGSYTIPVGGAGFYGTSTVGLDTSVFISCSSAPLVTDSVEDVQDSFTANQIVSQSTGLYDNMSSNVRGALGGGASSKVSKNGFFFSTLGFAGNKSEYGETADWNVWGSGRYTSFDADTFDGYQANLVIGLDKMVSSNLVMGALIGYDISDYDTNIASTVGMIEGEGITIGGYFGYKAESGLIVDGILSYSDVDYDIASGGTTGSFGASRVGLSVGVYNQFDWGSMVIEPHARLTVARESQESYVDSAATTIAARDVTAGRLSLGPKIFFQGIDKPTIPWVSVGLDYNFTDNSRVVAGTPNVDDSVSMRLGAGFSHQSENGLFNFEVDAGGLGSGDYTSLGILATYAIKF